MQPNNEAEKAEFQDAENMLMPNIRQTIQQVRSGCAETLTLRVVGAVTCLGQPLDITRRTFLRFCTRMYNTCFRFGTALGMVEAIS